MAWTGTVTKVEKQTGTVLITVRYSDGVRNVEQTYRAFGEPAEGWLEQTVKARIGQLEGADRANIKTGAVSLPPAPDEGYATFLTRMRRAEKLSRLVTVGAIAKDDPRLATLAGQIAADLDKYWDMIGVTMI